MLTSSVAHDFNNMLGVILGYADLALLDPPLNDSLNSHLIKIRNAALQSRELTRQLLSFARKQPSTPKVFDLNENVSKMISIFERTLGKAIKLA
jgi:signal transduction histidine kinase